MVEVLAESGRVGQGLHPLIVEEIARLMVRVNSYYTNAMEGNPSKLRDIDAALEQRFAPDAAARNYQLEHVAHVEVQNAMIARLKAEPGLSVCSKEFLCWLHREFFLRLPEEMRAATTVGGARVRVEGGELRTVGITVGRHDAPETRAQVEAALGDFERLLSPERLSGAQRLLGMAASHHRFLWVHPFPEGNGRVARLLTTAYGIRIGVGETLLWTVSRAFARRRSEYDARLANADLPRRNALDGRGPLSEETLVDFCGFFLTCCLDQIRFMSGLLAFEDFSRRYKRFMRLAVGDGELSKAAARVMEELLFRGEVPRGEIKSLCGVKQRRATQLARELLDARVARSLTPYGPLRLNIGAEMAAALFPELA